MSQTILVSARLEVEDHRGELLAYRLKRDDSHATYLAYAVDKMSGDEREESYQCRQYHDGRQTCTCKDYTFRKRSALDPCKHLAAIQQVGAFRVPPRTLPMTPATTPEPQPESAHECEPCDDLVYDEIPF